MLPLCLTEKKSKRMEAEVLEKLKLSYEQKLKLWLSSQAGQTSGYAYEKSFLAFMREVSQETLQASVGLLPTSKNKKKDADKYRSA